MDTFAWIILISALALAAIVSAIWIASRKRSISAPAAEPPRPSVETRPEEVLSTKLAEQAVEVVFGASADAAALRVSPLGTATLPAGARALDTRTTQIDALGPLIQALPSVLVASELGTGRYMKVVVDGTLAAASDGGFLPFVRDASGRVTELATLYDATMLSSLVNAAAVWQIASIIVAQKYLAEISEKLGDIKAVVDEISRFQKIERRSTVLGALRYFQELAEVWARGETTQASRHQLEDFYTQLTAVQLHLEEDVRVLVQAIPEIRGNDLFGSKDVFRHLHLHDDLLTTAVAEWKQCTDARLISWYLLMCHSGDHNTKEVRLREIQSSIERFSTAEDGLASLVEIWERKIAETRAFWNRNSILEKRRSELRTRIAASHLQNLDAVEQAQRLGNKGAAALVGSRKPIELAVRFNSSGALEAYQLNS